MTDGGRIDYSVLAFPKGKLRIEVKREKRLTLAELERECRAMVRARDKGRCCVPGCKEKATELHHLTRRSQSKRKQWEASNCVSLCKAHHDLEHAGRIHLERLASGELLVKGSKKDLAFKL